MPRKHPLVHAFANTGEILKLPDGLKVTIERADIPLPWAPTAGLVIGDAMGGHPFVAMPTAEASAMPPLSLTFHEHGPLFLGQQWDDGAIARWEEVDYLGIDRAALCVASANGAEALGRPGALQALEERLDRAITVGERWTSSDTGDAIAIHVIDDGEPFYYRAVGKDGGCVGWVVNLADVELPWKAPSNLVPKEVRGFAASQTRYGVVGRRAPTESFLEVCRALRFPKSHVIAGGRWHGARIGDLELVEVGPTDHHFFQQELDAAGVSAPAFYLRVKLTNNQPRAKAVHWKMMLAALTRIAYDTGGLLHQIGGELVFDTDGHQG